MKFFGVTALFKSFFFILVIFKLSTSLAQQSGKLSTAITEDFPASEKHHLESSLKSISSSTHAIAYNIEDTSTCNPPTFTNDSLVVLDASCGDKDGKITIWPKSGLAPYMYSIDGGLTYVRGRDTGYTFVNLGKGIYRLRLKDATGCESEVIERVVRFIYRGPAFVDSLVSYATCGNNDGKILITPTSGVAPFMYSIDEGRTYVPGPDSGYTFNNLSATTYFLRIKDAGECESAVVRMYVNPFFFPPAIETTTFVTICHGETYSLPWGGTTKEAGYHSDTLKHAGTICDSIVNTIYLIITPAGVERTANIFINAGETYELPWGETASISGSYSDTVRYAGTVCIYLIRTVNLTVKPVVTQTTITASVCAGNSYYFPSGKAANLSGVHRDTVKYLSGFDSLITIVNLSVKTAPKLNRTAWVCEGLQYILPSGRVLKSEGIYNDTVRYISGCDSLISIINLIVKPLPKPTITKSNDISCVIGSATLSAFGGDKYTWQRVSVNNANRKSVVVSPAVTTMYKVQVVGLNGCTAEDSIEVKVSKQDPVAGFFLPNAFTPNNDGKNDCFGISYWPQITDLKFQIFNRWGDLVFQTKDPSVCWDGTFRGARQPAETFVYQIIAKSACAGSLTRRGTVVLIR